MMGIGNYAVILFGLAFIVGGLALYRLARRASPERRYFRITAYIQMFMLILLGTMFIIIGIL